MSIGATILDVQDLWVRFGNADAVRGVSLQVKRGETVALVGESGSGKSVTALSILQLLPPQATHPQGSIKVDGIEMVGADNTVLRSMRGDRVSMVFQEPMTSLNPLHTIARQVSEALILHRKMHKVQAREHTLELLRLVGLQHAEDRLGAYPHELSGGQRQRVMIAMALANEPDLLVADEPTTALDVTIQAQILELLKSLQDKMGMAILFITHDLGIVRATADRVYVMTKGELVEEGPTETVFTNPQHEYTQHLLSAEPKGEPNTPDSDAAPVIVAEGLAVHYDIGKSWFGRKSVLKAVDDVSFTIRAGHTLGVVGESGSGKTTLGMALLRLLQTNAGIIRFQGQEIQGLSTKALKHLRGDMQVVFQDPFGSLSPRLSILQIIEEGLLVHFPQLTPDERRAKVGAVLSEVGLSAEMMDRYPHEFSGGQRQRISIARAMVLEPKFVVLDEPTSALDMSVQAQIVDLLRDLQRRHGLAYLFVSHDLKVVRALADELLVMKDGRIVEHGKAEDLFDNPQTTYTKALMAAAFDIKATELAMEQ